MNKRNKGRVYMRHKRVVYVGMLIVAIVLVLLRDVVATCAPCEECYQCSGAPDWTCSPLTNHTVLTDTIYWTSDDPPINSPKMYANGTDFTLNTIVFCYSTYTSITVTASTLLDEDTVHFDECDGAGNVVHRDWLYIAHSISGSITITSSPTTPGDYPVSVDWVDYEVHPGDKDVTINSTGTITVKDRVPEFYQCQTNALSAKIALDTAIGGVAVFVVANCEGMGCIEEAGTWANSELAWADDLQTQAERCCYAEWDCYGPTGASCPPLSANPYPPPWGATDFQDGTFFGTFMELCSHLHD